MYHADIAGQATGNTNHWLVITFGNSCDTDRYFAMNSLAINAPFAGNDKRRVPNQGVQTKSIGDNINTGA